MIRERAKGSTFTGGTAMAKFANAALACSAARLPTTSRTVLPGNSRASTPVISSLEGSRRRAINASCLAPGMFWTDWRSNERRCSRVLSTYISTVNNIFVSACYVTLQHDKVMSRNNQCLERAVTSDMTIIDIVLLSSENNLWCLISRYASCLTRVMIWKDRKKTTGIPSWAKKGILFLIPACFIPNLGCYCFWFGWKDCVFSAIERLKLVNWKKGH